MLRFCLLARERRRVKPQPTQKKSTAGASGRARRRILQ